MIEIQNGCVRIRNTENGWMYQFMQVGEDRRDQVEFVQITFVAAEGEKPEIGDFIEGGKLVKRTEPKVNPDWRKWKDKDLYGAP